MWVGSDPLSQSGTHADGDFALTYLQYMPFKFALDINFELAEVGRSCRHTKGNLCGPGRSSACPSNYIPITTFHCKGGWEK